MRIDELTIQNFRGFDKQVFRFHPEFNVIAGINGSGKTAILEALNVAIGSWLLGIRNTSTRHIRAQDIRVATTEHGEEEQYPVRIEAKGIVLGESIKWARNTNNAQGRTNQREAKTIKTLSKKTDEQVRSGEPIDLPILVYYSTGRLWKDRRTSLSKTSDHKTTQSKSRVVASRFRGYDNCLEASSNFSDFIRWYKGKELAKVQKGESSFQMEVVKKCVIDNLPRCKDIYYEFDPDKPQGLKVELEDGSILPFGYLSDGTRNILALMADLAYRCVTLNPHKEANAAYETRGVVLIDELDLHLHPEWQKGVVKALRSSFPRIQFITTTHSTFIMQETNEGELISLQPNGYEITGGANQSLEDIAEYVQDVPNPQWSKKKQQMYQAAREYYQLLEQIGPNTSNEELEHLKNRLDKLSKPFADNMAYVAFLEQKRLSKENGQEL